MSNNLILTFPRFVLDGQEGFVPWKNALEYIKVINRTFAWQPRDAAEKSDDSMQAIPCAYIQDDHGRFHVMRRIPSNRPDLNAKLSLVIGGHVDYGDRNGTFENTLMRCLLRELDEEVGIIPSALPVPAGMIIDGSSIASSRHVGFVHRTIANSISMQAEEEFICHGEYATQHVAGEQLVSLSEDMDPWSRILARCIDIEL